MDSNQLWEHLGEVRETPMVRNQIEHGAREFAAYLKHAGMTQAEYDRLTAWEQVTVLRRCHEWLQAGVDV